MGLLQQDPRRGTENKTERPDGSFLIDMERLSLLVDTSINAAAGTGTDSLANTRVAKTLSRKASERGDKKSAADDDVLLPTMAAGNGGKRGGAASLASAAGHDMSVAVVLATAAEATATTRTSASASPWQAPHGRRSQGRRAGISSPWLDPRRVLLFFATMSSMGTIILLYFTLSMVKMGNGNAKAL